MKRLVAFIVAVFAAGAVAEVPEYNTRYEEEAPWQELKDVEPPTFPLQENLREFHAGPATTNSYFIDASTLTVGDDRVVRYVLVVRTSGGATNVTFEGINCKDRTWKLYATGHRDGTWVKSRATRVEWRPIENKSVNPHHSALNRDLFCPAGIAITTAEEGRNALRLGMHPDSLTKPAF